MKAEKPNFVIFMLDQLAPQFLPIYGHKVYIRNTLPIFELEMRSRFPAVK
jgi:arylsulfatase A-like enzyme